MDTLSGMQLFAGVVEEGSFSAAGRRVGLTPSSVSRRISDMEDGLGARLFNRTTRKLHLTEAGEVYYQHVRLILADVAEANRAVSDLEAAPTGTLKVTAPASLGQLYIAPAVSEFLTRYPEVRLQLSLTDTFVDIVDAGFDVAVRIGRLTDSSLIARKLSVSRRIVCASPDYFARHGRPRKIEDIAHHNCLTGPSGSAKWTLHGPNCSHEVAVAGNFFSNDSGALLAAARAGIGLVLFSSWVVCQDLESGTLEQVFPDHQATATDLDIAIYAVYPHTRYQSPKVRAFVDFLVDLFRDLDQTPGSTH